MTIFNLDKIFKSDAVAVVGASEKPSSMGKALMANLQKAGFDGAIFPANPHYHEVNGRVCYPDLSRIGRPVAMAAVLGVIEACGAAGVREVVIISSGGREIGGRGRDILSRAGTPTYEMPERAVDARVVVQTASVPSPLQQVISPYPAQYVRQAYTKDGTELLIRPIKPEDAPLLVEMFHTLSPTSIYFRFFRPLRALSEDMLIRFTQIDYDRDMALVAMQHSGEEEKMRGVARLISDPDVTEAEFSIVVSDSWQGKGVGAILLEQLLAIARERGMATLWGLVLPENTSMLALGRKVGFVVKRTPGGSDYELRIDLKPAGLE